MSGLPDFPMPIRSGARGAAFACEPRDDVSPEIGKGRIAVQEDDRIAFSGLDVVNRRVESLHIPFRHMSPRHRARAFAATRSSLPASPHEIQGHLLAETSMRMRTAVVSGAESLGVHETLGGDAHGNRDLL